MSAATFALDPELTPQLRAALLACWVDVTNAGGAVGFVAPVTEADVTPVAEHAFARLAAGPDQLLVAYDGAGELAGWLVFTPRPNPLMHHWRTLVRVQVHPRCQGQGYGGALLAEALRVSRAAGWSFLHLTVRGGTGYERFYQRHGFVEVGRLPGAIRVGPGDDRDELVLVCALDGVAADAESAA